MLSNTCFEASTSVIQSMAIWCQEPMEKSVAKEIVDVLFGLQEVYLTLGLNLTDSHEINQRGSAGVVYLLLELPTALDDYFSINHQAYAKYLLNLCNSNDRLWQAFIFYKSMHDMGTLSMELDEQMFEVLNDVCQKLEMQS